MRGLVVVLLLATLAGCGYRHDELFREDVSTVAVQIFENRSFYRGVEFDLAEAMVKEVELRTPYKVTDAGGSDTLLEGRITSVRQRQLSRVFEGGVPQEMEVVVSVDFVWKELRTGRALRIPRARTRGRGKNFVTPEVMISERPAEAEDRAVPGHWEGDLILGEGKTAIGTLVERTTRFTMLLHLPPMEGHGVSPREQTGPALAGRSAEAVRDAIAAAIQTLPEQLRKSLAWDQGAEMAQHAQLRIDTDLRVYFCNPRSPWQRGTNENTNGLLRQYFPKGTDLSRYTRDDLDAVAATLNDRPRKTLGWRTPAEALDETLSSLQASVATTG